MDIITTLYDYQKKCFDKLSRLKIGALYMDMGTGKTRTALEFIKYRLNAGKIEKVVWLTPCSVKVDLMKEIIKHVGSVPSEIEICGIETLSSSIREVSRLFDFVETYKTMLIVDESSLVKNPDTYRTQRISRLSKKCEYRMILNGTPVSKNEADLYAQWEILDWRVLGYRSFYSFSANHLVYDDKYPNKIIRTLNVDYLTRRMAPYTYQVLKNDCINLPPKTYESKYYYLTENQSEFYDYIAQKMLLELDELKPHTIYKLFSALQDVISGLYVTEDEKTKRIKTSPFFNKIEENPRIQKLMDIISCIDDKVIIYCKYTHEILSIVELLNKTYGAGSAVPFYGGITHKKRAENKQRFENSTKFFVANKQCAGFGLNLQFCNYIIFYSNDWDYGTRTQAEDRVHRNGQKNNVCIIDIIAEHTLDERIKRCLFRKECLVDEFRDEIRRIKDAKVIDAWIHGRGE